MVGGDSAKEQIRALQEGVDIVCGTPGRLDDLITTGKLDLSGVGVPTDSGPTHLPLNTSPYRFASLSWMRQMDFYPRDMDN